jgi:CBS domain-containing protein
MKAIELLVKSNVPRVPIIHPETDQIVSILSQFDLVRYLAKNIDSLSTNQRKTNLSNLGKTTISSGNKNNSAMECFQKMNELKIGGLPILDEDGSLIATINASDLKFFENPEFTSNYDEILKLNVIEFLDKIESKRKIPIFCNENSTLEDLIQLFASNKIHRTFIVNEKKQALKVISLQDVLRETLTSMKSRDDFECLTPQIKKLLNDSLKNLIENEIEYDDDSLSFLESELIMDNSEKIHIENQMKKNKIKRRVAAATIVRSRLDLLKKVNSSKNEIFKFLDFVDLWKGYLYLIEVLEFQKQKKKDLSPLVVSVQGISGIGKSKVISILSEIFLLKNETFNCIELLFQDFINSTTKNISFEKEDSKKKIDFIFFNSSSNEIQPDGLTDYSIYIYSDYETLKIEKYNQMKPKVNLEYWEKLWLTTILPVVNGSMSIVASKANMIIRKNEKHQLLSFNGN